jgi:hypothetical protein
LPALYSPGFKVTDLRNPILANYKSCIHRGYAIYPNRLGFLDRQVVFACPARLTEQSGDSCGPFWRVGPPYPARPMWSHEGIRVYTPTVRCVSEMVVANLVPHLEVVGNGSHGEPSKDLSYPAPIVQRLLHRLCLNDPSQNKW